MCVVNLDVGIVFVVVRDSLISLVGIQVFEQVILILDIGFGGFDGSRRGVLAGVFFVDVAQFAGEFALVIRIWVGRTPVGEQRFGEDPLVVFTLFEFVVLTVDVAEVDFVTVLQVGNILVVLEHYVADVQFEAGGGGLSVVLTRLLSRLLPLLFDQVLDFEFLDLFEVYCGCHVVV